MALLLPTHLFHILQSYAALVPPKYLQFSTNGFHDFVLEFILDNPHFKLYPPSKKYQCTFWKWAIQELETIAANEDIEIDERIYDYYVTLLPSAALLSPTGIPLQAPPSPSYITHFWRPETPLNRTFDTVDLSQYQTTTLLESRTTIESGTTGLRTWLASLVLSQYLISHPDLVAHKRILELGSGIGFLGIIAASLQHLSKPTSQHQYDHRQECIWMTDVNENVLARCRENVQLPCNISSTHSNINYRLLDWSDALEPDTAAPLQSLLDDEIRPDIVLGADIVFDPSLIPALVGILRMTLQPHSGRDTLALIALTVRNEETLAAFLDQARQSLTVEELEFDLGDRIFIEAVEVSNGTTSNVKIFKMTAKSKAWC